MQRVISYKIQKFQTLEKNTAFILDFEQNAIFSFYHTVTCPKDVDRLPTIADPERAVWSESTLVAQTGLFGKIMIITNLWLSQ